MEVVLTISRRLVHISCVEGRRRPVAAARKFPERSSLEDLSFYTNISMGDNVPHRREPTRRHDRILSLKRSDRAENNVFLCLLTERSQFVRPLPRRDCVAPPDA